MLCFDIYTARPQYTNATAITQYVYSDSDVAELVCPFEFGLLSGMISPYVFMWRRRPFGEVTIPVANTTGRSFHFSDDNRILHVHLPTPKDVESYLCRGLVRRCNSSGNAACDPGMADSPFITLRVVGK